MREREREGHLLGYVSSLVLDFIQRHLLNLQRNSDAVYDGVLIYIVQKSLKGGVAMAALRTRVLTTKCQYHMES